MKKTRQIEVKNAIGRQVRLVRTQSKPRISQEDLSGRLAAQGIQITQTGISKIESGGRYVLDYEALGIARALKVSVARLYGEGERGY